MSKKILIAGTSVLVCWSVLFPTVFLGSQLKIGPHKVATDTAAAAVPVGAEVPAVRFKDVHNGVHDLDELLQKGPVVLVFLSAECPEANRYAVRLNSFHKEFGPQGVSLIGVYANEETSRDAVVKHGQEMGLTFPLVKDGHAYLARKLGATMTPQALVIDPKRVLRYRGAIDDNRYENLVKQHYLKDAVSALLKGQAVPVAETDARGCPIHVPTAATAGAVTYNGHVARILQDNCTKCHSPGNVGPFSLTTYQQARTWAKEIKAYTKSRTMPPWKATPGFGAFKNDRSLSDDDIALIAKWVEAGTPEGDPAELPPAPKLTAMWVLGEPDQVLEMPEEYTLGAEGQDDYRHFVIPTNFGKDLYLSAIDVQPGNRKIVHHVIAYVDTTGKARELDKADPGPGYSSFGGPGFKPASMLGGWAPGTVPERAWPGTGYWLPKGGDIVLQVHYARSGKVEKDRTKVALYFAKSPKTVRIHTAAALNQDFKIPAGAKRHEVRAKWTVEQPCYALNIFPHMHLLGQEMKVTAKLPGGKEVPLVWIKAWDFSWQTSYVLKEPLHLPKGTEVEAVAYYDNSAANPFNPHHPPQAVSWGERTTDEMCVAFLDVVSALEYPPK